VQGDRDLDFSKRMFQYYYRIFDKYDQDIVGIALLTDASKNFRPDMYHRSNHGTELTYKYNIYKFTDQDESELMKSANPFALAVLAGKYVNVAKSDIDQRYHFKRKLFQLVLQKMDYPPEQRRFYISTLIYFIDYLLKIPLELTQKLRSEMIFSKEEIEMMYLDRKNPPPTVGEIIEEDLKQVALEMLKDGISVEIVAKYVKLPIEVLEKLLEKAEE
jgi:hypothetical protein